MTATIDKHDFKITIATAILVILFIIVTSVNTATWKVNMESEHKQCDTRYTNMNEQLEANKIHILDLEDKSNERDIDIATIKTQLSSIQTMLIEIKLDLKELNKQ